MRLVIVSGLSGAGKSSVMKILEDDGFYCVDNLPVPLVPDFMSLLDIRETIEEEKSGNLHPDYAEDVAIGLDVRGLRFNSGTSDDTALDKMLSVIGYFRKQGYAIDIIFLEASTQVLVKRYKETRRVHPMNQPGDMLESGIEREREVLKEIKSRADYIIDSSSLLTRELKEELDRIFVKNEGYNSLMVNIMSFGFKYGIPSDADLVFDVRFLPNPFYIDELKQQTGNDKPVQDYVKSFPACNEFVDKLEDMITFLIPGYVQEGKYQLVVAIGCTGGQHRSVTIANELYDRLKKSGGNFGLKLHHKDIKKIR
jgi:UPF0042 nucleotide-binding protein